MVNLQGLIDDLTERNIDRLLASWLVALPPDSGGPMVALLQSLIKTPCNKGSLFWINHWGVFLHLKSVLTTNPHPDVKEHALKLKVSSSNPCQPCKRCLVERIPSFASFSVLAWL